MRVLVLAVFVFLLIAHGGSVWGQTTGQAGGKTASAAARQEGPSTSGEESLIDAASETGGVASTVANDPELMRFLEEQIELLQSPSFRARRLAYWRLQQHPRMACVVIERALPTASIEIGPRLIDLLAEFALGNDPVTSECAAEILTRTAKQMTSIGQLAANALASMADIQEQRAVELLTLHGARIGPRDFAMNGQFGALGLGELSLTIDEGFRGDTSVIRRIRHLKSIDTVFLSGKSIDHRYFEEIARLRQLRNIKLKHVQLEREDLELLRELTQLEHLGINYVDIDDSYLDVLIELPMSQSLRLYGTKISTDGVQRLLQQLDGLEITCLRGGFLGVGTESLSNTVVARITPGSAAEAAGLLPGDVLTHVGDQPIKTFLDLRQELGKYVPGDKVTIRFERDGQPQQAVAELTEEPDFAR